MTIAAIYAAGAGGVAASSSNNNMRDIVITDAILKYNEDLKSW